MARYLALAIMSSAFIENVWGVPLTATADGAPRDVARVFSLRQDAFKAKLASGFDYGCGIEVAAVNPFVE
jgi:hypothetical protein